MTHIGSFNMIDTHTKWYRLWERLVISQQTVVCCTPTAKPERFRHAETMSAEKKDVANEVQK